jgi:hypothetical protein
VRADIHDGQEHKRSMQGPDTDAQDQPPPFIHIWLATHGRSIQMGHIIYGTPYMRWNGCRWRKETTGPGKGESSSGVI